MARRGRRHYPKSDEKQSLKLLLVLGGAKPNLTNSYFLQLLHQKTGRNIIAYYSGFLSKPGIVGMEINDEDKNGFMMSKLSK